MMILAKFRQKYPQGSLVSELIDIDRGTYIVKVSILIDKITLASGLAGRETVEAAEDAARERAIAALILDRERVSTTYPQKTRSSTSSVSVAPNTVTTIAQKQIDKSDVPSIPNSSVVDFADRPTDKKVQSDLIVADRQEDFNLTASEPIEPQINVEPEITPPPKESVSTSENLFEETLNTATITNSSPTELENLARETNTLDLKEPPNSDMIEEMDFNEIKQKTDIEIKRLGWTKNTGQEFLKSRYGKLSRLHLTDRQLLEFLHYLESQPSPD